MTAPIQSMEEALVGTVIRYPEKLVDVMGVVLPHDLTSTALAEAYKTAITLFQEGHTVDLMAIVSRLGVGKCDAGYLASLDVCASKTSVGHYAGEISREVQKKRIAAALKRINQVLECDGGAAALTAVSELVATELKTDKKDPRIKEVLSRFDKIQHDYRTKGAMGVATGMDCFDRNHIQYVPGHVWVIGAFTSVGKTAMSIQQWQSASQHRGMFISTEMTEEQVVARIVANRTGIPSTLILSGRLNPVQDERVEREKAAINTENLKIYDDVYHIDDIENAVLKAHLQGGIDIVWVDYVQNITSNESNEYQALSRIAKRLQALAKKARCCLILLSQLSNAAAQDDGGVLQFKGAGEFSAIADLAIILSKNRDDSALMMQTIRKNRHGKLGKQAFRFNDNFTSLYALEHHDNV